MKTLEEIKDEVAFHKGWVDWQCFRADCDWSDQESIMNEVAKRYALEAIKADREITAQYFQPDDRKRIVNRPIELK